MESDTTSKLLLTTRDNLTELREQSDLQIPHQRRSTPYGFLVQGELLVAFVPTPPNKRPKRSWIWKDKDGIVHGEPITKRSTGQSLWLCKHCYNKEPQKVVYTCRAEPTTAAQRHLAEHGYNLDGTKQTKRKASEQTDVRQLKLLKQQDRAQATTFVEADWHVAYVHWIAADDVSLRGAVSNAHKSLLTFRNPIIAAAIPSSHNTIRQWIIHCFTANKSLIQRSLARARSRITLSFDGWKSDNEVDYLGVVAHYIDEDYQQKVVLLALRNTYGNKTGVEMKHHLHEVAREFKITKRLAYFMADNASNNDKAVELLSSEIDELQPVKQRLRCAAHTINLVCKSILYGVDSDCLDEAAGELVDEHVAQFERVIHGKDEAAKLKAWRRKGPLGKLHNVVIHARASPSRRKLFMAKQRQAPAVAADQTGRLFELVINGGIRWNSTYDMIERAFKLKDALELYQQAMRDDDEDPLEADCLSNDDWHELKLVMDLLKPLKQQSFFVQADGGSEVTHGSLHEAFTSIDYLLTKLEEAKRQHHYAPHGHFKASINLGWKKLNKYYALTDATPAYRVAVVLHPHYKMEWFEKHWRDQHAEWISDVGVAVRECYKAYERRFEELVLQPSERPCSSSYELDDFTAYNTIIDDLEAMDELERYLREPRAGVKVYPLQWWQSNEMRYPILSRMAFDHLAAPASSSADERVFSKAGNVINEERWHMLDDLAEALQCLKSWHEQGLLDDNATSEAVEACERAAAATTPPPPPANVLSSC